jgi:endonuclease/exonuclease/phosphatase family metal-dependent hydrolase
MSMRAFTLATALAVGALLGCSGGDVASEDPPAGEVAIAAYNVQGGMTLSPGNAKLTSIAEQIAALSSTLLGVNECTRCDLLLDNLPDRYELIAPARAGVSAIYDASRWRVNEHVFITLGENDDGFGERVAMRADLTELESGGKLRLYATHWCVVSRRADDPCDVDRLVEYADAVLADMRQAGDGVPALLVGDLNVIDGKEDIQADDVVLERLSGNGLIDVARVLDPDGELLTYHANGEAQPFRLDYIFASAPVEVLDARIDDSVPVGTGSDHFPVTATVQFRER